MAELAANRARVLAALLSVGDVSLEEVEVLTS